MSKLKITLCVLALSLAVGCSSSKSNEKIEFQNAPEVSSVDPSMTRCKQLFEQTCQHCHKLPLPAKYSREKWNKVMPIMAAKSKIDQMTSDSIFKYVQAAMPGELQAVPSK